METLLDYLNARTFTVAAVTAAALYLGITFQKRPRDLYQRWRYAAQTERTAQALEIERDLDAKASLRLRALHREVSEEISRAVADGFAVAPLQATADGILQLDTPALRSQAVDRLQKLRLAVPRKAQRLRVASAKDDSEDSPAPRVKSDGPPRTRDR